MRNQGWLSERRKAQRVERFGGMRPHADAMLGLSESTEGFVDTPIVGWMVTVSFTVVGIGHICKACRPSQPLGMDPVADGQLAAKQLCRMCRQPLEAALRQAQVVR